uniref:G-protein coupled receptors family 1 profile domain-containing protein n=1 Tax=Strigamia maritima TaxID=126957 RepID=T1J3D6_STRMM
MAERKTISCNNHFLQLLVSKQNKNTVHRSLTNGSFVDELLNRFAKLLSFTWDMGEFLCKFVHYIQSVSAICSVLTLTSMSLERYYAILHPIKAKYICTISQAQKVIAGIWFLSFLLATPTIFMKNYKSYVSKILYAIGREQIHFWCVDHWDNTLWWKIYEIYYLSLLLLIPTIVMGFTYTSICLKVWQVMQQRATMISRNGKNRCLSESYPMAPIGNNTQSPASSLRKKNVCHQSTDENATVKQVPLNLVTAQWAHGIKLALPNALDLVT